MTPEGDDARARLIDTAERLFAERGVEGVSIREITREAGVNVAAVHYHFGSKDALLHAVLDRNIEPLTARRGELLDAALAAADGAPLSVEQLLEAFLRPDLETINALRERAPIVARFIGRTYGSPSPELAAFIEEQFAVDRERFYRELGRALPHLDAEEIDWRMRCIVGVIVALFGQATPAGVPGPFETGDVEATLHRLVAFCASALRAPAPATAGGRDGEGATVS